MSSNPWLSHVKTFREKNPNIKYKEALIQAKETYRQPAMPPPPVVEVVSVPVKKDKKSSQKQI